MKKTKAVRNHTGEVVWEVSRVHATGRDTLTVVGTEAAEHVAAELVLDAWVAELNTGARGQDDMFTAMWRAHEAVTMRRVGTV